MDASLGPLKLLSKNCHVAEMQCAMCSSLDECRAQLNVPSPDETEFGSNYQSGTLGLFMTLQ